MSISADSVLDLAYDDVGADGLVSRAIWHTSEETCISSFSDESLIQAIIYRGLSDKLVDEINPHVLQSKCKEIFYQEVLEDDDEIPF